MSVETQRQEWALNAGFRCSTCDEPISAAEVDIEDPDPVELPGVIAGVVPTWIPESEIVAYRLEPCGHTGHFYWTADGQPLQP